MSATSDPKPNFPRLGHFSGARSRASLLSIIDFALAVGSPATINPMKNKSTLLKVSLFAGILAMGCFTQLGCATEKTVTTTTGTGTNTVTTTSHKSVSDPLLHKVVIQEDTFYGLNCDVLGNSYTTPFKIKFGFGRTIYRSLPTSTNQVFTAAYNATAHGNASVINQTADESVSTTTNLADYSPQSVTVFNPTTGQFGSSPLAGYSTNGLPIYSAGTNSVTK